MCQWLLIFTCQSFSFQLTYLNHTHFLHCNIIFVTLNTMTEPTPAKLHPTCVNDHDGVKVCHWTIANTSQLPQMHWLLLYCMNGTLLEHAMLCLKNSLCPGIALMKTKWKSKKYLEGLSFWKAAQAAAGKCIVNTVIFSRGLSPKLMKFLTFAKQN